jgi:two-component system alkaline phosphatase synthesis response regulator PhoP
MDKSRFHILIVDDEQDILEFLSYNLSREGYRISTAGNGREAVEQVAKSKPDLILMDIMMPEMDGISAVSEIKTMPGSEDIMIVFLTARSEEYSQIAGFKAGADDYVSKPVKPKVLVHRLEALLRRMDKGKMMEKRIKHGNIVIDPVRYIVEVGEQKIGLPRKEFELLAMLATHPDKVFNRDEILTKVWGKDVIVGDRTIDVHIRKIREKIGNDIIATIKGVGYKFVEPAG